MIACDLFTVETVFLRRLYVLVFIELATRKLNLAGGDREPDRGVGNPASAQTSSRRSSTGRSRSVS
jgi:hypothetical protein